MSMIFSLKNIAVRPSEKQLVSTYQIFILKQSCKGKPTCTRLANTSENEKPKTTLVAAHPNCRHSAWDEIASGMLQNDTK